MKTPFWWAAIQAARENGNKFTSVETALAMDWPTCACGKQDPAIPRRHGLEPLDKQLFQLGIGFADAVIGNDPDSAAGTLLAIEARAAEVLAAQGEAK